MSTLSMAVDDDGQDRSLEYQALAVEEGEGQHERRDGEPARGADLTAPIATGAPTPAGTYFVVRV